MSRMNSGESDKRELCHRRCGRVRALAGLVGLMLAMQAGAAGRVGESLPALKLPNLEGEAVALRAASARVTVINFWASWCKPCQTELPNLEQLEASLGRHGLRLVGIAVDSGTPAEVRAFAQSHGVNYPILLASSGWARGHFGIRGIPVTLVVDRRGVIRARLPGPQPLGRLMWVIRRLLAQ
jgi:peroxiredoxin